MPFLENVVRGKNVPRRAAAGSRPALRTVRRRQPDQRPEPRVAGGAGRRTERPRAAVAGLLGQPQLASAARRCRRPDGRRRRAARLGVRHLAVRLLSGLPAVSRRHRARPAEVGPAAPQIDKLRLFYNHPGFIEAMADRVAAAWNEVAARATRSARRLALHAPTASRRHGRALAIRTAIARGVPAGVGACLSRLSQGSAGMSIRWRPGLPEPQRAAVAAVAGAGHPRSHPPVARPTAVEDVVVVPIGFLAENMEVVYDLDVEVAGLCDELGVNMVRAGVVAQPSALRADDPRTDRRAARSRRRRGWRWAPMALGPTDAPPTAAAPGSSHYSRPTRIGGTSVPYQPEAQARAGELPSLALRVGMGA